MKRLILIGLSVIFLLIGCMKREGKTLRFWALGSEGENVQQLIPEFEHRNPDIKVIVQQIPWTAAHEKLLTAFAGNTLPDLCQLGNTWIPEFSSLGALEPLDAYVAGKDSVSPANFFKGIWEINVVDDELYGVPWYVDTRVLFYRKDLLARAGFPNGPRTWDEWIEASERIAHSDWLKKHYAVLLPTNEWPPTVLLGLEAGSLLLKDQNTRADFNSVEFNKAFAFLRSFYIKGYSPNSWLEIQNLYQAFAEGYIAMYITGPWNVGEFKKRLPLGIQDKWMTAPMPTSSDRFPGHSLPGGSSLIITRMSKHKSAAWKLIHYLVDAQTQLQFHKLTGNLPSNREAWEMPQLKNDPYMKAFFIQLQYLRSTPKIPEWEQIATKIMEYTELAANRSTPNEELLEALNKDVNRILEKRRWLFEHNALSGQKR